MTASTRGATASDRLRPWIESLRVRATKLPAGRRGGVDAAIALLEALHAGDAERVVSTLTDEVVIHITGWTIGGSWQFSGTAAHAAVTGWMEAAGDTVLSMRGDIDRFFPDEAMLGMDGVWSRLDAGVAMTSRRFGWFITVAGGRISAMDLYWSIHQQSE